MEITFFYVLLIAVFSALLTLVIGYSVYMRFLLPRLQAEIDKQFDEKLEQAVEVLSVEIKEAVRKGVLRAVSDIPSTDTLRETTQTLAKTGVEIMGASFDVMRGRKR